MRLQDQVSGNTQVIVVEYVAHGAYFYFAVQHTGKSRNFRMVAKIVEELVGTTEFFSRRCKSREMVA